jgi:hypothetical protein
MRSLKRQILIRQVLCGVPEKTASARHSEHSKQTFHAHGTEGNFNQTNTQGKECSEMQCEAQIWSALATSERMIRKSCVG